MLQGGGAFWPAGEHRCPDATLSAFARVGVRAGTQGQSRRNLDSPGLEMVGNCSWEAHPGGRSKASVARQQRGLWARRGRVWQERQAQPSISFP